MHNDRLHTMYYHNTLLAKRLTTDLQETTYNTTLTKKLNYTIIHLQGITYNKLISEYMQYLE